MHPYLTWLPRQKLRKPLQRSSIEKIFNQSRLGPVVGVDEAGRGACAGPLVVAACVLPPNFSGAGLRDSKSLSEKQRENFYSLITADAVDYSIITISPQEIDRIGVHRANIQGMRQAVACLSINPGYVLTDGFSVAGLSAPSLGVIKGDDSVLCIAAASVLAKVTRDQLMHKLDKQYPDYGFALHKGYGTSLHQRNLYEYGPCEEHRFSYRNVAKAKVD